MKTGSDLVKYMDVMGGPGALERPGPDGLPVLEVPVMGDAMCSAPGCEDKATVRGRCELHYRLRREKEFWTKVDADGDCWEWIGSISGSGYGRLSWRIDGRKVTATAHRLAYEMLVGPIPDGLQIDHLCRNRRCINPDHLEPVSPQVNQRRGFAPVYSRLRCQGITHCPKGHPYDEANTYICKRGKRNCRACHRVKRDEWNRRRSLLSASRRAVGPWLPVEATDTPTDGPCRSCGHRADTPNHEYGCTPQEKP